MIIRPSTQYRVSLLIIGGGLSLSFTHSVLFAPVFANSLLEVLASFLPPIFASGAALPLIVFVHSRKIDNRLLGRAAIWYLSCALFLGAAISISFMRNIEGVGVQSEIWFSVVNWTISGSVIGLVVANYDLRRTWAIRQARTNEQKATRLSQRLSVLNRVLRHDIRNRTTIIQGHAQYLEDQATDSDSIATIEEAATSLITIADRVRQLQQIVEEESPQPVHLTTCVTDLIQSLRDTYPDAHIRADIADDITAQTYPAVRTVLDELLENAIEHNPQPEPDCVVAVTVHRCVTDAEEMVEIVIEDNGPGIPDQEQVVLSDEDEDKLTHSRGMNLWLTRWVLDESDGDFTITSTDSEGTRIQLRLPIGREHTDPLT